MTLLSQIWRFVQRFPKALKDFKKCLECDPDRHDARIAQEKLTKRLKGFGFQRVAETIAPWAIFLLSVIVFGLSQYRFFTKESGFASSDYMLLTFGSLLFAVVALFLPYVIKLKVGNVELEKSPVEQITTFVPLGIKHEH